MKKHTIFLIVLVGFLFGQACNADMKSAKRGADTEQTSKDVSNMDEDISDFMTRAFSGGMMEVQLGEMAEQNSKSEGVRNFGIMMVKDHQKANSELRRLASRKDVSLPAVVNEDHQKYINELTPLRGLEFDEKYMDMMVDDHEGDIDLFEEAADFKDPDVSAFAAKTLPVLKKHFEAAKKIKRNLTM
jgi:putative membrane protein